MPQTAEGQTVVVNLSGHSGERPARHYSSDASGGHMTTALRQKLDGRQGFGKESPVVLHHGRLSATPTTPVGIVRSLAENGADLVELGIPFSDPIADGPVIQAASEQALRNEVTLHGVLDLAAEIRLNTPIPIVLMGYANPIFRFGMAKFFSKCAVAWNRRDHHSGRAPGGKRRVPPSRGRQRHRDSHAPERRSLGSRSPRTSCEQQVSRMAEL